MTSVMRKCGGGGGVGGGGEGLASLMGNGLWKMGLGGRLTTRAEYLLRSRGAMHSLSTTEGAIGQEYASFNSHHLLVLYRQ